MQNDTMECLECTFFTTATANTIVAVIIDTASPKRFIICCFYFVHSTRSHIKQIFHWVSEKKKPKYTEINNKFKRFVHIHFNWCPTKKGILELFLVHHTNLFCRLRNASIIQRIQNACMSEAETKTAIEMKINNRAKKSESNRQCGCESKQNRQCQRSIDITVEWQSCLGNRLRCKPSEQLNGPVLFTHFASDVSGGDHYTLSYVRTNNFIKISIICIIDWNVCEIQCIKAIGFLLACCI